MNNALQPVVRDEQGRFPKGVSGCPGGFMRKLREKQVELVDRWSPHAHDVMARLLDLAKSEPDGMTAVSAAKEFLKHAVPEPKFNGKRKEKADNLPGDPASLMAELLKRPDMQRVALEVLQGGKK